jgi:methyl-accepting chemotaxis protein
MDKASKQVVKSIEQGNKKVDLSINKVNEVKKDSKEVANTISDLDKLSKQIGEIVEFISNISDQTNLLALNATIEAARSEESPGTTERITKIIYFYLFS